MQNHQQSWEILLPLSTEKTHENSPDFVGEAHLGSSLYDAAVWFGQIKTGKNIGRPYLGLQLVSKGNATQKVNISLWEKLNRKTPTDPHFRAQEQFHGQELSFSAWIQEKDGLFKLRILIEPSSAGASDLSEAALATRDRLAAFLDDTKLRLLGGQPAPSAHSNTQPTLPLATASPAHKRTGAKVRDPDLDAEPDDIPF
jgi:hypothetical protein